MMPFGQTAKSMAPAIDKFETFLFNREIRHNGNPVLTWCMSNAVVKEDDDGHRKISKRKSIGRVDGAVTVVMAAGISERTDEAESAYANMTKQEMIDSMAF
jgi:phage terminase large subunit-like protein